MISGVMIKMPLKCRGFLSLQVCSSRCDLPNLPIDLCALQQVA